MPKTRSRSGQSRIRRRRHDRKMSSDSDEDEDGNGRAPPSAFRMVTRSKALSSSQQNLSEEEKSEKENEIPIPAAPLPPPRVYVQYLEEPKRKVVINESKSIIFELTQAIEEDAVSKVTRLVKEKGVDVNYTLPYGVSILLKAVRSRATKVVHYLLEHEADTESSVCDMMKRPDALHECYDLSRQYDDWCVQMLQKMLPKLGDRVQSIIDQEGRTLLHLSCFFPVSTIFNYLLEQKVDPNALDNRGSSVLTLLISHRDWSVSKTMVESLLSIPNINVDICDYNIGSTPLFQSFLIKRLDIFFLLLAHGANPFICTHAGSTLMHLPFLDCTRLIILYDLGLDVNALNTAGKRPLQDRHRFDFVFFVMIILGRRVTDHEFQQMEGTVNPAIISIVKNMLHKGSFSSMSLKALCRRTIRKALFKRDHSSVTVNIDSLPLPNPLKLYLDVCSYAQSVINSLSHGC